MNYKFYLFIAIGLLPIFMACNQTQESSEASNSTRRVHNKPYQIIVVSKDSISDALSCTLIKAQQHPIHSKANILVIPSSACDNYLTHKSSYEKSNLFDKNWHKIGELNKQVNNPEFAINATPLRGSSDVFIFDALYGLERITFKGGHPQIVYKLKFNPPSYHNLVVNENKNTFHLIKHIDNTNTVIINYNLENGVAKDSFNLNEKLMHLQYFPHAKIYGLFFKNKTEFKKAIKDKPVISYPEKLDYSNTQANQTNTLIRIITKESDTLTYIAHDNNDTKIIQTQLPENFIGNALFISSKQAGILAFETNTPGSYSNETKLSNPMIFTINQANPLILNTFDLPEHITPGYIILSDMDQIYLSDSNNIYRITEMNN